MEIDFRISFYSLLSEMVDVYMPWLVSESPHAPVLVLLSELQRAVRFLNGSLGIALSLRLVEA